MSARLLTECGLCGSTDLRSVLQLGFSPPTCVMPSVGVGRAVEEHHPLELLECRDCTLVQLSVVVDPETVFPPDYPYSSGNSRALHDNFADLAREVGPLGADELVVDIGANDGTLLSKFVGHRTVGVEPTGQAEKIKGPAYREFFTADLAHRIVAAHGQAKVVTACNVLAHVDDIDDVMRGIAILLADDGVLVAENHDLASVVDGGQWDTVYHEHLRFWSPHSFHGLLDRYGFQGTRWQQIPTHGGSFRVLASRGYDGEIPARRRYDFTKLTQEVIETRRQIRLATAPGCYGIGATARATTVINYCGLDVEDIECVCEVAGSDKIGRHIPGTRIPVVDERRLLEDNPPRVMLFSWHLADSIIPKLRKQGYGGVVIVPLPRPRHLYHLRPLATDSKVQTLAGTGG